MSKEEIQKSGEIVKLELQLVTQEAGYEIQS